MFRRLSTKSDVGRHELAPRPGWTRTPANSRLPKCERCGMVCDDAAMPAHVRWHVDLEHRLLPRLGDFLTVDAESVAV